MKLTKSKLKRLVKEELEKTLQEEPEELNEAAPAIVGWLMSNFKELEKLLGLRPSILQRLDALEAQHPELRQRK